MYKKPSKLPNEFNLSSNPSTTFVKSAAKHKGGKSPIGRVGDGRISSHFLWMSAISPLQPTPFPDAALPREPIEVRVGGAGFFVLPVERFLKT